MKATLFIAYILLLMYFVVGVAFIYLFVLVVRALKKYIKSEPVRKEKAESAKSLGEVIKRYRTQRKMTQEFVAESLGVSRQAVSKWESGASDPSTTNLMALPRTLSLSPRPFLISIFTPSLKPVIIHWYCYLTSGNSSVGRAQPCQGWGRGSESRFPLDHFCIKPR